MFFMKQLLNFTAYIVVLQPKRKGSSHQWVTIGVFSFMQAHSHWQKVKMEMLLVLQTSMTLISMIWHPWSMRPVLCSDINFRRIEGHTSTLLNSMLLALCCYHVLCGWTWSEAVFIVTCLHLPSVQCVGCWWWLMTRSNSLFCGSADTMEKRSSAGKKRTL